MPDFFNTVIRELTNPQAANFWTAWQVVSGCIASIVFGIFAFFKWLANSRTTKIERILIFALVNRYENWVRIKSKSKAFNVETLAEWLSSGNIELLGNDYTVFENFMERLHRNGRTIITPDEDWFLARTEDYKTAPHLGREEW